MEQSDCLPLLRERLEAVSSLAPAPLSRSWLGPYGYDAASGQLEEGAPNVFGVFLARTSPPRRRLGAAAQARLNAAVEADLFGLFAVRPIETRLATEALILRFGIPVRASLALILGYRGGAYVQTTNNPWDWAISNGLLLAFKTGENVGNYVAPRR